MSADFSKEPHTDSYTSLEGLEEDVLLKRDTVLNLENATKGGKYKNIRSKTDIQTRQRNLEKVHARLMTLSITKQGRAMLWNLSGKKKELLAKQNNLTNSFQRLKLTIYTCEIRYRVIVPQFYK